MRIHKYMQTSDERARSFRIRIRENTWAYIHTYTHTHTYTHADERWTRPGFVYLSIVRVVSGDSACLSALRTLESNPWVNLSAPKRYLVYPNAIKSWWCVYACTTVCACTNCVHQSRSRYLYSDFCPRRLTIQFDCWVSVWLFSFSLTIQPQIDYSASDWLVSLRLTIQLQIDYSASDWLFSLRLTIQPQIDYSVSCGGRLRTTLGPIPCTTLGLII
jgi:hypothetical protein